MQRAFTEKETRVFSQRAGASQFDDFIMTAVRNLAQNQNYYETKFFLYSLQLQSIMPEPRKRFEGRHWSGRESPMGGAGTDVWTEPLIPDGRWESWRPFLWFKMTAAQGSILHVHGLTEIRVATWSCWSSECMENSITFCHDWPPGLDRIQWTAACEKSVCNVIQIQSVQ